MLIFKYPERTPAVQTIEERLAELVVAHQIQTDEQLKAPVLEDGTRMLEGTQAIHHHLDELQGELKQWWYCAC